MIFPHSVTFTRAVESSGSIDPETGLPTGTLSTTTVYSGSAFVQDDSRLQRVSEDGNIIRASDARVFLPPGERDIQVDDELTWDERSVEGRVKKVSVATDRFYTEVLVKWQPR